MKKILSSFFFFVALAVGSVTASATGAGGFVPAMPSAAGGFAGPGPAITSARDAAAMRDDTPVVMRGHIVQHLGGEKYMFRDASGTIRVDIDNDKWPPQPITPNHAVILYGEVDKD